MLPKQVTELLDGFVRSYDFAHRADEEFRKAHNRAAERQVQRGFPGLNGAFYYQMIESLSSFLEGRTTFIWVKLQEVTSLTETAFYPEMATDMKAVIAAGYDPTRKAAEQYLERLRQGLGHSIEAKRAFDQTILNINAEVDLFCAAYTARKDKINQTGGTTYNFDKFTGVFGPVTNSEVSVHDNSSIFKLLIDHNVPMRERHELEGIMEELKTAPPENKPSLVQRGKDWIVRNKEFLGASTEIVSKALG